MKTELRLWAMTCVAAASALVVAACGGSGTSTSSPSAGAGGTSGVRYEFPHPTRVDNPSFPLVPGTQFSYEGKIVEGGKATPHTVIFTVTDLTKMVNGVRTVVAWDRDFLEGKLREQELAFFAQDSRGNVWNFGEYPEEYENGKFTGAPSTWVKGSAGGFGGIHALAKPRNGVQYVEGRVPSIDFYDVSKVVKIGHMTCTGTGCFRDVVVVDEWSPPDRSAGHQIKYYAPGTGLVQVGARGGDSQEFLKLASVYQLGKGSLAQVRAAVLAMDHRAYRVSKVYRATEPADCCRP
jgi:hypothetical protein